MKGKEKKGRVKMRDQSVFDLPRYVGFEVLTTAAMKSKILWDYRALHYRRQTFYSSSLSPNFFFYFFHPLQT
jgi:hypothetical protein